MKIVAVVHAKGSSERVVGKNLRYLNGELSFVHLKISTN